MSKPLTFQAKPLAIDLCCGLGGWSDGLLAEGWDVVGFDVEHHRYGDHQYPAQLVLQDVLTLTGEQFRGKASLIVASPPCQKYSYMAMPWKRAKALQAWYRDPEAPERLAELNAIFNACVRIGKEACCPTIIENVRGAQPWVGRARWAFGSFYLWGDVPALMPPISRRAVLKPQEYQRRHGTGSWSAIDMKSARAGVTNPADIGLKVPGVRFDGRGSFQSASVNGIKGVPHRTAGHWTNPAEHIKCGGDWFNAEQPSISRLTGSRSPARKAASAIIAKIPLPLARHIAAVYREDRHNT